MFGEASHTAVVPILVATLNRSLQSSMGPKTFAAAIMIAFKFPLTIDLSHVAGHKFLAFSVAQLEGAYYIDWYIDWLIDISKLDFKYPLMVKFKVTWVWMVARRSVY